MDLKIIYEDANVIALDKAPYIAVLKEGEEKGETVADLLVKQFPYLKNVERNGIVHRIDKDTSGLLLVAKNNETFEFLQEQWKKNIEKRYIALVSGIIKEDRGKIETLLGRSPQDRRKQKAYPLNEEKQGRRKAETEYFVLKRFKYYTLVELHLSTGRKHQIRAHMANIQHPVVKDKLYSFKNEKVPKGLERQFLHASFLKIKMLNGKEKEFKSELPEDLKKVLENLE